MPTNAPIGTTSGPASGLRIAGLFAKIAGTTTTQLFGLIRGFGGPTALYGSAATDAHLHMAVAETYDDAWQATSYTVGVAAVELCATPLANRKAVTITLKGTAGVTVHFGPANTVTTTGTTKGVEVILDSNGYGTITFPFGIFLKIWAIGSAAGTTATCAEMA